MSLLTWVAIGIYMAGHGTRGLPGGGLIGSIAMIVGGLLIVVGQLV
jgi:hypothetical protein